MVLDEADALFDAWEVEAHGGALALLAFDLDFAAVGADDAAHDEETEAGSGLAAGAEGLEEGAHEFGGDSGSLVLDGDDDLVCGVSGGDGELATGAREGLAGVAEEVEEGLAELVGIDREAWQAGVELQVDAHVVGGEFGFEGGEGFLDELVEVFGFFLA